MINRACVLAAFSTLLIYGNAQNAQVTLVLDDITTLDQDVKTLTAAVDAYTGQVLTQSAPMLIDFTNVHLATEKGFVDSETLPAELTDDEATSIITLVNNTLSVDNPIAVAALEAKKPLFQAAGMDSVIQAGLELLLSDHLEFSNSVLARVPQSLLAEAEAVVNVITDALEDGIAYFSD